MRAGMGVQFEFLKVEFHISEPGTSHTVGCSEVAAQRCGGFLQDFCKLAARTALQKRREREREREREGGKEREGKREQRRANDQSHVNMNLKAQAGRQIYSSTSCAVNMGDYENYELGAPNIHHQGPPEGSPSPKNFGNLPCMSSRLPGMLRSTREVWLRSLH